MKIEEIMKDSAYNYKLTEIDALSEGWKAVRLRMQRTQGAAILHEEVLLLRLRTQMTRIGWIFTDIFNPWASAQSVFHRNPETIDDDKKPQINADERRYVSVTYFIKTTHRKGRKERKAMQQESLRPLRSLRLNVFSAPAHERAPPQPAPAVHSRSSRAGG